MSLSPEEHKLLDEFAEAMADNLMATSREPYSHIWPAPVANILVARWYSHSTFPKQMYSMIRELEGKGYAEKEIANVWGGPSRICLFLFWVDGKATLEMPADDIAQLAVRLIKYIGCYRRGDIYCRDGRNLILSDQDVERVLQEFRPVVPAGSGAFEELRTSVARLNTALWLYTELLYFACHSWGHEFHGPYPVGDDKTLVVRQYYDLKPAFWGFSSRLRSERLTAFEIYEGAEIAYDMLNRTRSKGSPLACLRDYGLRIGGLDGDVVGNLEELRAIENNAIEVVEEAAQYESTLGKRDLIRKFNEATFHCGIKPLAEALGQDWAVPEHVYDMIEDEAADRSKFLQEKLAGLEKAGELPPEVLKGILRDSFDPRVA